MNIFHLSLFSLLFALPLLGNNTIAIDAELKKLWPANRTVNIVFHGHSVPSGYHVTPDVRPFESYPHLFFVSLKNRYPNAVINIITTAIGGENSIRGATRFADDVFPHRPDLIFIDYGLNDRARPIDEVETAWRSMISEAKTANVPLVLITPTGASNADFSDPADPLSIRAALIRRLAAEEEVLLADVSAAWLAALNSGTPQEDLLSQGNHPNLQGHRIASQVLYQSSLAGLGEPSGSVAAAEFPRDRSTNTFTTADTLLTFTTSNLFSGQGNFLGDSGGPSNRVNSWDGDETLRIDLASNAQLSSFQTRWTVANLTITGFTSDPKASISNTGTAAANGAGNPGSATWNPENSTLVLNLPWDGGNVRSINFANPQASTGQTLNLSFSGDAPGWQASFVSFDYQATAPTTGNSPFSVPLTLNEDSASFTFNGMAGTIYEMQRSASMAPDSWIAITAEGPLANDQIVILTDRSPLEQRQFYRIAITTP